jgi:predicted DNA-binding protein
MNPKTVSYSVRLDPEMEKSLREYCEQHGITRMEAIRQGIHLLLAKEK